MAVFSSLDLASLVDISKSSLTLALLSIAFNPTAWNVVARNEYRNKTITRLFGGNTRYGCYFLAILIFSFGVLRDSLYQRALADQPRVALLPEPYATLIPAVLFIVGQTFVITSTWALGITGTFLGDYFGILMEHRVEGFPFNVLRDPMYVGSTMCFAAGALWYERPAGLLITFYVYIVYAIALRYEGPFTDMIYAKRAEERAKGSKKQI
ncbi:Phosphatidyl-N-methylethanolamine N-methyltransferase [Hypsizygus marmoreus]|uniref:Phosphatidyl-N-methylethanolamine N-methyltransferase n=1 Tax=Hypsizygus marmoreus TaxID=39966 RepID=A0A369JW05_HYPMA|nr:Phosphatidyl-N-methylethanolamine N-methyltransferase [Hypsizygus marmoreus]